MLGPPIVCEARVVSARSPRLPHLALGAGRQGAEVGACLRGPVRGQINVLGARARWRQFPVATALCPVATGARGPEAATADRQVRPGLGRRARWEGGPSGPPRRPQRSATYEPPSHSESVAKGGRTRLQREEGFPASEPQTPSALSSSCRMANQAPSAR